MRNAAHRSGGALLALIVLALLAACDISTLPTGGVSPPGTPATASATPTARGTGTPGTIAAATATGAGSTNLDYEMRAIARTNMYRAQNGCPALATNSILMGTALAHSEDMALHHFFAHTSSDGTSPWARIRDAGYNWLIVAENIASATRSPEQVVDGWFNETPPDDAHRANILNCKLRDVGVGYYTIWEPAWHTDHPYWTEDFGTPVG